MSAKDNLNARLKYSGGNQKGRMISDKEKTLKKVLLSSYQSATAVLSDGREFLCLINPNKLTNDYDDKIISIPFKDVCLNGIRMGKTNQGQEEIGLKAGQIIKWKETDSYWIVTLQHLEEYAYFRANLRRCRYEIDINGNKYKVYIKGPVQENISWDKTPRFHYNNLNYTLLMTVSANEETLDYFHRFKKFKFEGNTWEVQAIDDTSTEGIIDVYCKEYSNNPVEEARELEKKEEYIEIITYGLDEPHIEGDNQVYPYDIKEFVIKNATNGQWKVDSKKIKILEQNSSMIKLQIISGRSGNFVLSYENENEVIAQLSVDILSL